MASSFNPFNKSLSDIQVDDLQVLTSTSEGWYVEYKSRAIKPVAIAKSLTSFANQYGGYLIFGVSESGDKSLTAGAFPGIPDVDVPTLLTHIRDSSASHSNPTVYFEQIVLAGPCSNIGLPSDHSIVVVEIRPGLLAPYVHSSGRIYRRVGDSSEPKPETDRYQLGELFNRRDEETKRIRTFVKDTDPTVRDQGISSWLQLYLIPDPNTPVVGKELTTKIMAEIFGAKAGVLPGLRVPMNSIYPSAFGHTATQFGGSDPNIVGLSIHVSLTGNVCFCMPINLTPLHSFPTSNYKHGEKYVRFLAGKGYDQAVIADCSKMIVGMAAFMAQLLHLKDLLEDDRDMIAGFRLSGLLGACPFVDSEAYLSNIEEYGIPILEFDKSEFPSPRPSVDKLIRLKHLPLDKADLATSTQTRPYLYGHTLMSLALSCVGISGLFDKFDERLFAEVFMNFDSAKGANSST